MPGVGIIRNAGIIRGRVLYEEIRYSQSIDTSLRDFYIMTLTRFIMNPKLSLAMMGQILGTKCTGKTLGWVLLENILKEKEIDMSTQAVEM